MSSSKEYLQYAQDCTRWAAEAKNNEEDQKLFIEMAKAWTNLALVDADVAVQSVSGLKRELYSWSGGWH
jgi:hypothetical protein